MGMIEKRTVMGGKMDGFSRERINNDGKICREICRRKKLLRRKLIKERCLESVGLSVWTFFDHSKIVRLVRCSELKRVGKFGRDVVVANFQVDVLLEGMQREAKD